MRCCPVCYATVKPTVSGTAMTGTKFEATPRNTIKEKAENI